MFFNQYVKTILYLFIYLESFIQIKNTRITRGSFRLELPAWGIKWLAMMKSGRPIVYDFSERIVTIAESLAN